jgi:histidyl-tRNA synthetase
MQKQFKYADARLARFVAIIGENELTEGTIQLKNMETGEQNKFSETDFLAFFQTI